MFMKYITFEGPMHQEIVVFAAMRNHSDMAKAMNISPDDILGAGEISMDDFTSAPYCRGKSTTLGVLSRGHEDTRLLALMMGAS